MKYPEICYEISRLIHYGTQKKLISKIDSVYATNRLLEKLQISNYEPREIKETLQYPAEILQRLCDCAVESGIIEDTGENRDKYDTELMDCLMPRPSEVMEIFNRIYIQDRKAATEYYYELSKSSNYIRVDRIEKDLLWTTSTSYGDMIITVNLSKPEKDPRDIAAARSAVQVGYPKCALCRENEGFAGGINQAARANHRLIQLQLEDEFWYLQYSPYVYYNEHCILLNGIHKPMVVNRNSMGKLLEFVTMFPHYFVGSNADLPIVGGSILTHDHFQGGNYEFPMAKASIREEVVFSGFGDIHAGIVNWPMSTLRISSTNKERLVELAGNILDSWRGYSDEESEIFAFTTEQRQGEFSVEEGASTPTPSGNPPPTQRLEAGGLPSAHADKVPHNTITPIARFRNGKFELDLVLRNNRTNEEHPMGIFHPHSEYHHIKRENIGLIEVMGLAILPARLLNEMELLKTALLQMGGERDVFSDPEMKKHKAWYEKLRAQEATEENVDDLIKSSIGEIFANILENAGVYKDTVKGNRAFKTFCESVV